MKKILLAAVIAAITAFDAQSATLHAPDAEFIEQTAQLGIDQSNWDSGNNAKLTFQNAYRFTYSVELNKGKWTYDLGKPSGFDLDSVSAHDFDKELPMTEILRDRLNYESLVILKDGKLLNEWYWNGMNKDQIHLMMSTTKSFTGIIVNQLIAEGKVKRNALISDYLPELKESEGFRDATVEHVLDMRSGIKIEFTPGFIWDERMTNVQQWNGVNKYPELKSILDFGKTIRQRSDVKTGQAFDYQCVNTEMLGMLIQRVTGKTAAKNLEERIWKKIGVEHNAFIQSNANGEAVMSGGLNATTRDVVLMMDVLVNGGKARNGNRILPEFFIKELMEGNKAVKDAWQYQDFAKLLSTAWYKDQIRVLDVDGTKYMIFVGIHGQVFAGHPKSGVVIGLNGAQPEMQAGRTVAMTMLQVIPTLIKAVAETK